eukprot:COSAG02_NODE_30_length_50867_cov_66.594331_23_plen_61_part_00
MSCTTCASPPRIEAVGTDTIAVLVGNALTWCLFFTKTYPDTGHKVLLLAHTTTSCGLPLT